MIDQAKEAFKEEAFDLLAELETSLLELEERPEDLEVIGKVFRAMHTIKGSGAMFGFEDVASFTHEVESVFDLVRNSEMQVTPELVTLSLSARDHIRNLLDNAGAVDEALLGVGRELVGAYKRLVPPKGGARVGTLPVKGGASSGRAEATYRIRMRLCPDIILRGTDPLCLIEELSELGPCCIVAQTDDIPALEEMNPEHCYCFWDLILTTGKGVDAVRDVFIFVEDEVELKIDCIDSPEEGASELTPRRLGEILLERGDVHPDQIAALMAGKKPIGELLVEARAVSAGKIESALQEQQHLRQVQQQRKTQESTTSIRVSAERLDALVNMVGELVIVQARLTQVALSRADANLIVIAEELERLTDELRDSSLTMRMLPIGSTFSKFKRLVRDLSQELAKDIELSTSGAETELDKTVMEKLNDPLVHLIRNSIDHGIEMPEKRVAMGKPAQGRVHLSAVHSGDSVLIEITDDGKGLDRGALLAKAVEKGLISADARLSDREIFELIFAPGFSTAKSVTSVSGRGVGMDVVKKAIDALRGSIHIDSDVGKGTKIRIKLPLTLAIVESLLVNVAGDHFVLPLSAVEECIELTRKDLAASHGRDLIPVRGSLVPYVSLRRHFKLPGEAPDIEQIVVTQVNGNRVGFVVDHVIGEHQTVIKSLGRLYRDLQGISGATVLGDGDVALILDVPNLVRVVEEAAVA